GVGGAASVVLDAAVGAGVGLAVGFMVELAGLGGGDVGADEDADRDGHLLFGDEVVEDGGGGVADAVLADEDAGGGRAVVLGGDVDPVVAMGAGEDLAVVPLVPGYYALGDAFLGFGVGAGDVL